MPHSYTKFLVDTLTGLDVPAHLMDAAAVTGLGIALAASVWTNIIDWRNK
jgi:hypothetical protein